MRNIALEQLLAQVCQKTPSELASHNAKRARIGIGHSIERSNSLAAVGTPIDEDTHFIQSAISATTETPGDEENSVLRRESSQLAETPTVLGTFMAGDGISSQVLGPPRALMIMKRPVEITGLGHAHGMGALSLPGGGRYEGRFEYGLPQGQGAFASSNGDVFAGEWMVAAFLLAESPLDAQVVHTVTL